MSGELLVILVVALIVFGPDKLPGLACKLGKVIKSYQKIKHRATTIWQEQESLYQLNENIAKAHKADKKYKSTNLEKQNLQPPTN